MRAGSLDRRITIERATESRDAFNNMAKTWAPLTTVWASKQETRDTERVSSLEVGAEITMRFQIRWSTVVESVNPKDRIVFDGRTFDIVGVKEIGRREGIEISAAARAD